MKRKIIGITVSAVFFALCMSAEAQQPKKIRRIGVLSGGSASANTGRHMEAFRQGLRQLGYVEGKNIIVESRWGGWKNCLTSPRSRPS